MSLSPLLCKLQSWEYVFVTKNMNLKTWSMSFPTPTEILLLVELAFYCQQKKKVCVYKVP